MALPTDQANHIRDAYSYGILTQQISHWTFQNALGIIESRNTKFQFIDLSDGNELIRFKTI